MTQNKKIQNAEQVIQGDIKFRSKAERMIYNNLISLGYSPEYEVDKFIIWEGFYPTEPLYIDGEPQLTKPRGGKETVNFVPKIPKFNDWHYTPDFKLTLGKSVFYIECKGYSNDLHPYKRKLFLRLLENMPNTHYFEVKTKHGLLTTLKIIKSIYEQENTN